MGVYTFTVIDETSSIAPHRLFTAMSQDNLNLFPKIAPQYYKSAYFVEGDSTVVGAVKQFNYAEGNPFKYVKVRINELDVENYYVKYTNFESDFLGDILERIVYDAKIEPTGTGSHYKLVGNLHTKEDIVIKEEDVKAGLQSMLMTYRIVVEYLCNNPELYA